jgi:hypothetical protein
MYELGEQVSFINVGFPEPTISFIPKRNQRKTKKTYNTEDSQVVTDPTTSLALLRCIFICVGR